MTRRGKVWIVGAGPGAADLITLRGARAIGQADVVIWAASLVHPEVLGYSRPDAEIIASSRLTLEQVLARYAEAAERGETVARVHSGDPSLYGAIQEQIDELDRLGLDWEIIPGVSSLAASAAALGRELTIPEVAQSLIVTRLATSTPMPAGEQVRSFARHGTTMALFLSTSRPTRLQNELLAGGYRPATPCAVVYRASWPEQQVLRCPLSGLAATIRGARIHKHALVLVGPGLSGAGTRSHLYAPDFSHQYRQAGSAGAATEIVVSGAGDDQGHADLREPDLPRTAKVRTGPLRTGWTTGTCAAAAAKAAVAALCSGRPQSEVVVPLPSGRRVTFPVLRCEPVHVSSPGGDAPHGVGRWEAVVVKDAGDDPDCTDGAEMTATVRWVAQPGVHLVRGEGVGVVTKPGLGLEVGVPAINPVPRRMIGQAVGEVISADSRGVEVSISVPGGEQMAKKTTNRRLGVLGGISILGTSGIVRPFSTASWRASVLQAVDVMAAQGEDTCVLTTGGRTERAARLLLPALPEVCFVEVGDFSGAAIRRAASRGLRDVLFVGMMGKLAKLGAGVMMTHWTRSKVDAGYLGEVTRRAGGDEQLVAAVKTANTARHAYELWTEAGLTREAAGLLCTDVAGNLARWADRRLAVDAVLVDFDSLKPVAASPGWESGLGLPETAGGTSVGWESGLGRPEPSGGRGQGGAS